MGFTDKLKSIFNINEDDYFEDSNVENFQGYDDDPEPPAPPVRQSSFGRSVSSSGDKVVSINGQQGAAGRQKPRVVLVKPSSFEEAREIADQLKNKYMVILNLEEANRDVARRLVDFLSGVAYANSGTLQRVANSTFVIAPCGYDVMGDLLGELESNGMFFR